MIFLFLLQADLEMGILQVLKNFARGTSIHGLNFIVKKQLPIWERVTWTLVFIGAMIYATERLHVAIIGKNGKVDFLTTVESPNSNL